MVLHYSTGAVLPASSDGAALGSASAEWSDVFVADAGVLNLGDDPSDANTCSQYRYNH